MGGANVKAFSVASRLATAALWILLGVVVVVVVIVLLLLFLLVILFLF